MSNDSSLDSLVEATVSLGKTTDMMVAQSQPWSSELVMQLTYTILGFISITLILCTILLWKKNVSSLGILRLYGIISIVGISAVLLITGFSNDQLTPIVGLFGAIAGYLLGKDSPETESNH